MRAPYSTVDRGRTLVGNSTRVVPNVEESEVTSAFRLIHLDALVRMNLTSHRRKDHVHLLDLIDVGLIDESWVGRLPQGLAERLRTLIENPDG